MTPILVNSNYIIKFSRNLDVYKKMSEQTVINLHNDPNFHDLIINSDKDNDILLSANLLDVSITDTRHV